jgi:hypothetical protein
MKKLILVSLFMGITAFVFSQNNLKPVSINVFKNGSYYIVKEGNLKVKDDYAVMEIPENPLMSTFWITTVKDVKISQITYLTDTLKKIKPALNIFEIIEANKGKKIKLTYKITDKDIRETTGFLVDYQKASGLIKLKVNDNKTTYLYANNVVDITFDESPSDRVNSDSLCRLAKIKFDKNLSNVDLKVIYMQTGIQWLPSYCIKIVNDKELQLEMKALVENYTESVENVDLTLTVGAPQFYFNNTEDPIGYDYLTNLYSVKPQGAPVSASVQSYYSNAIVSEEKSLDLSYSDYTTYETAGEKTNDLYMYKVGKVSLPEKSKASFQIFSVKVPYKDVYEVNIGDVANYSYYGYINLDPEKRYDVYHSFKITNATTYPFTTAPAFVLNEQLQPLAQDQIKYTPMGSNCSVQLSKAGDVIIKYKEEEVKKEDAVKRIGKITYNKITVKGTINIENSQDKKIDLIIKKDIVANVINTSNDGKAVKSGKYSSLNPNSNVSWDLPLNSKEKKEITYTYEVYVNASLGSSY